MKSFKSISYKIAYCGIICALSVIIMLISLVPGLTYAMPAISGILIWSVSLFISPRWALLSFTACAMTSLFLIPEPEANTVFILFFGYYPIVRDKLATLKPKVLSFIIKLAIFNAACVIVYQILCLLIGVDRVLEGLEFMGDLALYGFWGMANFAFICYEICLSQLLIIIEKWIRPKLMRRIK